MEKVSDFPSTKLANFIHIWIVLYTMLDMVLDFFMSKYIRHIFLN